MLGCYDIMKKESDSIIYSPSDLIRYLASPFASWLNRYMWKTLMRSRRTQRFMYEKR